MTADFPPTGAAEDPSLAGPGVLARGWPGLDATFHEQAMEFARSPAGAPFLRELEGDITRYRGEPFPLGSGVPMCVEDAQGRALARFAAAYHRCVETIVRAWCESEEVRRVVVLPGELSGIVGAGSIEDSRIHFCRLDMVPGEAGGCKVVETNANCPGGLELAGRASRAWRGSLSSAGLELPDPLDHEGARWMGSWFLKAAAEETGEHPEFVVLLRWEGGNRLSLPGFATELRALGTEVVEADPRELAPGRNGALRLNGRRVRHAYWKLGMRHLRAVRSEVGHVIDALQEGRLWVQNGVAGRFVGDNKLCLAILSDPEFRALFDGEDLSVVRSHVPWSRNISLCDGDEVGVIKARAGDYVLKSPLDTRGNGVVIGREVASQEAWERAVDLAVAHAWLVQAYFHPAQLDTLVAGERAWRYHDLTLGLVGGRLAGAYARSSHGARSNVAVAGCLHPVFSEA